MLGHIIAWVAEQLRHQVQIFQIASAGGALLVRRGRCRGVGSRLARSIVVDRLRARFGENLVAQLLDANRNRLVAHLREVTRFHLLEDVLRQRTDALRQRSLTQGLTILQLLERQDCLGIPMDALHKRAVRPRPPVDPSLEPAHDRLELWCRVHQIEILQGAGHEVQRRSVAPTTTAGGGERDHRCPFSKRRDAIIEVVYLAFGEDHQRSLRLGQHVNRSAKGAHVRALAIDAERSQPLKREPFETHPAGEDLPSREVTARYAQSSHRLKYDERIAVSGMIDRKHDAMTCAERRL